jgi:hypothetical protein
MKKHAALGWAFAAAVLFLLAVDFGRAYSNTQIFIFQTRDLARAALVAAGQPIFYGPEVTGGGNLPGGFYYYLLALPLALVGGWEAAWAWLAILCFLAAMVGGAYLRARISPLAGLIFVGLFASAALTRVFLRIFLNVSYLTFFAITALVLSAESCIAESAKTRRRALWAACFTLGIGIQLHFSIVAWLFALLFLHLYSLRRERVGVEPRHVAVGLLFFFLPLLPFFVWSLLGRAGVQFGQPLFAGGSGGEIVPTYLHFLSAIFSFPWKDLAWQLPKIFEALPMPLVLLACLGLLPKEASRSRLCRVMIVFAAFGLIPFSYYFVAPIGYRYGMAAYLPFLVVLTIALESLRSEPRRLRTFSLLFGVLLVLAAWHIYSTQELGIPWSIFLLAAAVLGLPAFAVMLGLVSRQGNTWYLVALGLVVGAGGLQRIYKSTGFFNQVHIPSQILPSVSHWTALWRKVYALTGWSYEEASRRIFYVGQHLEQDGRPVYESMELPEVLTDEELPYLEGRPHGFFATLEPVGQLDPKEWLLRSNVQSDIRKALHDGSLIVGRPNVSGGSYLFPYWVLRETFLPRGFHNNGMGYLIRKPAAAEPGALGFRWNNCPGKPEYCENAASVRLMPGKKNGEWVAKVKVEGTTLSQSSPWVNPDWTENLQRPYVELQCGKRTQNFALARSIGYNRRYGVKRANFPFNYNNSILAPFEKELVFSCPSRPQAAVFGAEGTEVDSVRKVTTLPAFRFEGKP